MKIKLTDTLRGKESKKIIDMQSWVEVGKDDLYTLNINCKGEKNRKESKQHSVFYHRVLSLLPSSGWGNFLLLVSQDVYTECAQSLSCVQLLATPWTVIQKDSSGLGHSPGKNTAVGCHISPSRGSSHPTDGTQVSDMLGQFSTGSATREAQGYRGSFQARNRC